MAPSTPVVLPGRAQASSASESASTLAFGSRVSEITLGRASRNTDSAAVVAARQAAHL